MRPKHPPAVESGFGKHKARESESAQHCAAGKERVANAHPQLWPRDRKVLRPNFFTRAAIPAAPWPLCLSSVFSVAKFEPSSG